ncbi:MAG: YidC/Oxa1 family membrane protein insertase [Clostridia bacterium]|nr:YidC/Oxa1 family membrane protein insertase [Clostridia bacterium]
MNIMDIFYIPFGYVMKGCLWVGQNYYWVAIILFSLIMELVLLPLSIKQQKSSVKQATLRPKEIAIKRKYKNRTDRESQQQMNMEIQEMYQKNGYNMFGGCLPLLIQLPIIMILYSIVRQPLQYTLFVDDDQLNVMYKNSIELCETVKEHADYELDELTKIKEPNEEQKEKIEFLKDFSAGLTVYQQNMCDKYYYDEEADKYTFYFEGDEDIHEDAKKSMKNEYYVVAMTKHFDMYVREPLEEYGLCGEFLSASTEDILKTAFDYEENKAAYEIIEKLPNYSMFGKSLLDTPSIKNITWLVVVPFLVFITSFMSAWLSRKLQPQNLDADGNPVKMPGGKMMEWGMPLLSLWFAFNFQAALGIYWVWRSVFSMGKQLIFAKVYPIPSYTEEEIKAAIKEITKTKKKKKIVIEVDEDDHSYDGLKVSDAAEGEEIKPSGTRKIKMMSIDDSELPAKRSTGFEEKNEKTDKE